MKTQDILISYVIPVYNTPKEYLNACLKSLSAIKSKRVEFLVIDDGSTNKDVSLVFNFFENDNRFKFYSNENKGVSYSRNFGIEEAFGKYIIFVDSDDIINEIPKEIYDSLENKVFDLITFNAAVISQKGKIKKKVYFEKSSRICGVGTVWAKIYCKDFLIKNNILFDSEIKYAEDTLFNYLVLDKKPRIQEYPEKVLYYYRVSTNHTSTRYNPNAFYDFSNTFVRLLAYDNMEEVARCAFHLFYKYILGIACYNKECSLKHKKKYIIETLNDDKYIYLKLFKELSKSNLSLYGRIQFLLYRGKHFYLMVLLQRIIACIFKKY